MLPIFSSPAAAQRYLQTNLVSNIKGLGTLHRDSNLVNPWGVAFSPLGPFWIADAGKGISTLYSSFGRPFPSEPSRLLVSIAPSALPVAPRPTAVVFNNTPDFTVMGNGNSVPSLFIFATLSGTISGWNFDADPSNAILEVDNSALGAAYTGLALGRSTAGNFLYAADFGRGVVDVFDKNFAPARLPGAFLDPSLPAGFAPFGIRNIGGKLYVTYARQNHTPKGGFVDAFDADGNLIQRFGSNGPLNAPWGLALAPADFGQFSHDLLVGNFGDGHINAFDPVTGTFLGLLLDAKGTPIKISGLRSLVFGNGGLAGKSNSLFFTAGINDEADGLFGRISPLP